MITDPFYVMSTAELVKWLNETHPYRSWHYKRAGQSFGPYPRLAQAVQDRKMDGTLGCVQRDSDNGHCAMLIVFGPAPRPRKGFSAWEVDGEYDMLDLEGAEYRPFFDALASHFEMPPRAGLDDTQVANQATSSRSHWKTPRDMLRGSSRLVSGAEAAAAV